MTFGIEVHLGGFRDASTLAKSQVSGIFGLQVAEYTLGLFPMVKKNGILNKNSSRGQGIRTKDHD